MYLSIHIVLGPNKVFRFKLWVVSLTCSCALQINGLYVVVTLYVNTQQYVRVCLILNNDVIAFESNVPKLDGCFTNSYHGITISSLSADQ